MPETVKNKVKFNISNIHYAPLTKDDNGLPTFGAVKAIPGAVNLSLSPTGEMYIFRADGVAYYRSAGAGGYNGTVESALATDEFLRDILKEVLDKNNVQIEKDVDDVQPFAFGFQIDGDKRNTRFWFYNTTAQRVPIEASTNTENREVKTDTISISMEGLDLDGSGEFTVRSKTTENTSKSIYDAFFNAVYVPTYTANGGASDSDSEG